MEEIIILRMMTRQTSACISYFIETKYRHGFVLYNLSEEFVFVVQFRILAVKSCLFHCCC